MLKKVFTVFFILVILVSLSFAVENKTQVYDKAPTVFEKNQTYIQSSSSYHVGDKVGTAVLVATMWNAYSTQGTNTNLIYFDPYSDALAVIHRGNDVQASGSGYAFYAASDDGGANWLDGIGPFNFSSNTTVRHPNLVISNPTQSTDPFSTSIVMFWNTLQPANWQTVQTVTDGFFGASALDSAEWLNTTTAHFSTEMDVVDLTGKVYAPVETQATIAEFYLFWTSDLGTTWDSTIVGPNAWFNPASAGFNGAFGVSFTSDGGTGVYAWNKQAVGSSDYNMGFVKTSDAGLTWDSSPTWLSKANITNLPSNISGVNYQCDVIVDGLGDPHFVGTWVDTVDGSNTGVYEVFWNGADWEAELIGLVNTTRWDLPGGLETLNEPELARSLDGTRLYVKYIDLADTTVADSLADIFIAYKDLGGNWSEPENITQTPLIHEKYSQLASRSTNDKLHIYYTIFGDGDTNDLAESEIWYIQDVFVTGVSGDPKNNVPTDITLHQNFPNPFNPSTDISFDLNKKTKVELAVFNVLGEKVATIFNGNLGQGNHSYRFNGENLTSGVYFYTLTADGISNTKKMILIK